MVELYEQLLGMSGVSIDDDFFELGGDSLGALRLAARLRSGGFETSDEWVFKATTPRDLASLIGERTDIEGPVKRSDATAPELTPGEAAILFEQAADPRNVRYNVARDYHIETSQPQAIDLAQLARSVEEVAARHAPFTWTYSAPRRKLKPSSIVEVDIEQATTSKEDFDQLAQRAQRRPFDLDNGPMLRLTARHLDDGTTAVSIATHHVTIDAGTFDVLWHQIDDRYRGGPLRAGDDAPDNADVFSWQIGRLSDAALDRWIERLQPSPAEIDLGRHDGADGLARRVLGLSEHQLGTGLSTFTTLLAAWVMALRRRSDGNEILTGVVTSVRTHQAMDDLVGYHLNTLPMMIDTGDETTSMSEVVSRLKASTTAALADRTVPLASIVSELRRRTSRELELSNLFVLERLNSVELGGHRARPEVRWSGQTVADATLFVQVTDGLIELLLEYRGSKLSESNALLLLDDVAAFAESIVNLGPLSHLSVPLPSDVPPASLLEEPAATSLVEILAKAAATTTATSVIDAGGRLSWPDLWQGAQRLAGYLDATGLSSSTVAVEARRSSATVMAMLGIQLAQGAYQPIDPAYPADYLVQVLKDSESRAVLVDGHPTGNAADAYRALGTEIIDIRSALTSGFSPIERTIGPADPAYVIHTSGSTGLPKGVLIRQSHIAYSTMARSLSYPQSPERFLMISSMAFDSSMVGLWWPLSFGGTVVLPQDGRSDDVAHIIDLIEQHRITHTLMLPTLWEIVLRTAGASRLGSLKVVIVAGEACSAALVRLHHSSLPGCLLANEYGPTEGTVWSHRLITQGDESDPVPIGQVAPGSRSIVVGPGPVKRPVGVPGELLISGPGVADGYLGRPELSAESFVEFESTRWYRTGDLVDVHASGGFRFLGRVDDQVKVRGHRIELAAVDALVTERAGAPAAATVAAAANGTQQLVVFVEGTVDAPALRESLKASLPPAMVPSRIDRIDRLPRRPNGKLDRKALADLDHQRRSEESEPNVPQHDRDGATNEVEAHLLDAWRSALGIETIGPDDDFFDLGGDSIVAIRIAAALSKHGLTFSPRTIFEHATVRSLAAEVEQSSVGDPPLSGHTDLLPIQRWFFERGFAEPDRWSQGIVLNLAAAIDTQELEAAIGWLVNRHESLRATFEVGESGPTQTIHPSPLGPPLIGIWPDDESAKTATTDWLDIGTGRLLAAGLIGTEPSRRVVINAHHLVVDAVSWAILTEDLEWFLSSRREPTSDSPPMRHTSTQSWVERLRDMPPVAASGPQVSTRPTALEHETVHVSRQLSPQAAQRMLSEPRSIADTVAGAAVAAAKASDSPLIHDGRLAVTFERHGREASRPLDLTRTVGWFTTTETIHATATDDPELALAEVRSCLEGLGATDLVSARRAIQHGDTGPDDVVRINQLGSVPGPTGTGRVIELVEGPFAIVGDKNRRTHLLGILIRTGADQVELFFDYAPSDLPDAQAIALIDRLVATLEAQSDRGSHNADSLQQRFALSGLNEQQLTRLGALLDGLD
ncbi:MAG: amino acid adenylation domain-containing protein [Acidimicrobiales bacterium]|nr:amino acid adenylation domain-containing protein [Acidimicrobiales bacterium]